MLERNVHRRADLLIAEGLAFDLDERAATAYVQHCRELLAELDTEESRTVVQLRAASSVAAARLPATPDALADRARAADETLEMAQRLADELAYAYALTGWGYAHPGPEHSADRVRAARRALAIADRHGESAPVPAAYLLLLVSLLEQGEIRSLDTELVAQRTPVALGVQPRRLDPAAWFSCLRSILDGEAEAAEQLATEIFAQSPQEGTVAPEVHTTQLGMIRWMQGRMEDAEERFLWARRKRPDQLLWPASLAWLWLLQGRRAAAVALLNSLPDVDDIPRDRHWLATMVVLAEIARMHGPRDNAERMREVLLPFADTLVPVGVGIGFWGTAARTLGLLEEHLGLLDAARAHLELAVDVSARVGAMAWHAEAQIELAGFALRHDVADIPAYDLLAEARHTSRARGFAALAHRAMPRARIRVLGGFEVTSVCGTRAEWTSRKARELLKMLVAARGVTTSREVFMHFLWPDEDPATLRNRFSVAVNVIRRALDPGRLLPTQHHLVTEGDSIRLDTDHLDIDLERFLSLAKGDDVAGHAAARELYRGEAFAEEPYADWAVETRNHAARVRETLR